MKHLMTVELERKLKLSMYLADVGRRMALRARTNGDINYVKTVEEEYAPHRLMAQEINQILKQRANMFA